MADEVDISVRKHDDELARTIATARGDANSQQRLDFCIEFNCIEELPELRKEMGAIRCVPCQEIHEKRRRY